MAGCLVASGRTTALPKTRNAAPAWDGVLLRWPEPGDSGSRCFAAAFIDRCCLQAGVVCVQQVQFEGVGGYVEASVGVAVLEEDVQAQGRGARHGLALELHALAEAAGGADEAAAE